jgi:hypothetical protein
MLKKFCSKTNLIVDSFPPPPKYYSWKLLRNFFLLEQSKENLVSEPTFHLAAHNSPMVNWDLMLKIPVVELGLCPKYIELATCSKVQSVEVIQIPSF